MYEYPQDIAGCQYAPWVDEICGTRSLPVRGDDRVSNMSLADLQEKIR
jgi:hypothetical protein